MRRAVRTPSSSVIPLLVCLLAGLAAGQYVEDSIDVGAWAPGGIAYNSRENVVYFSSQYDGFLAIDCATNQVITRWGESLPQPVGLFYDSLDHKSFYEFTEESLMVIDGTTHQRRGAMRVPGLWLAKGLWAADDNRLYYGLSNSDIDSIVVVDCAAESVVGRIGVSAEHSIVGLNLEFDKLYVGDYDSSMLWIIDRRTNRVSRRLETSSRYYQSLYSEAHRRFFYNTGHVYVIDGETDSLLGMQNVPGSPRAMAEIPELGRLVIACPYNSTLKDTVYTLDMYTFEVLARIPVGNTPRQLLRSPETGLIYCRNFRDTISVISADGLSLVAQLGVGHTPQDMLLSTASRRLYTYCHDPGGKIYVIRDTLGPPAVSEAQSARGAARLTAFPSPFWQDVCFSLPDGARLGCRIYAPDGRLVRTVHAAGQGQPAIWWDGRDEAGKEVPPGVYTAVTGRDRNDRIRVVKVR